MATEIQVNVDELTELREDRQAAVQMYAWSVLAGHVSAAYMPVVKRRIFALAREYGELGEALRGCGR